MEDFNNIEFTQKDHLYSRQIAAIGVESMNKISKLNVLIIGMKGFGVEIAKNIILQGPNKVSLFDNNLSCKDDLCSNFYLSKDDISKKRRDESVYTKLAKLNKYVKVECLNQYEKIDDIFEIVDLFNVIVITVIINKDKLAKLNDLCRKNGIKFIFSIILGLTGYIFSDFGNNHIIYNKNNKEPKFFYIQNITNDVNGRVTLRDDDSKILSVKSVVFSDIEGMSELNNKEPISIYDKQKNTFCIGDTSKYNKYIKGGIVKEKMIPVNMHYKSLIQRLELPYDKNGEILSFVFENENKSNPEFLFLYFREIIEFYSIKNYMPENLDDINIFLCTFKEHYNKLKNKNLEWVKKIDDINENSIKTMCKNCSYDIPCITSFIGGIVSHEIIKSIGMYMPINQWGIFDFSDYYNNFNENKAYIHNRYSNFYNIFGYDNINNIQNKNILLIGAGALGCELLKQLSLLGIMNVTVLDDDYIELSNLNRQFLFSDIDIGKSKVETACDKVLKMNPEIKKYNGIIKKLEKETENIFNYNFWSKQDVVLCALDSVEGRKYIDTKCTLIGKPWINGGMNGLKGKTQIFIPFRTCCFNDINSESDSEKKENETSCTLKYFPNKIEDCIQWSKNLFTSYFIDYIRELENIFEDNNYLEVIKKEIENNEEDVLEKINIIYQYLKIYEDKNLLDLVDLAFRIFYINFNFRIKNLLNIYPADKKNEDSTLFWSGQKKIPHEINFNLNGEIYYKFIYNLVKILGNIMDINLKNVDEIIKEKANKLFKEETGKNIDKIINKIIIIKEKINNKILLKKIEFSKDSTTNGHIDFIHCCTNLRAINYNIPQCDIYKTFKIAGNIAPSTVTMNAALAGIMTMELISLFSQNYEEKIYIYSIVFDVLEGHYIEEVPSKCIFKADYYDKISECNYYTVCKFSSWDKINISGSKTLSELIEYIQTKYDVSVTLIDANGINLYEKKILKEYELIILRKKGKKIDNEKLLNSKIEEVFMKNKKLKLLEEVDDCLFINIFGNKNNGRSLIPIIKYDNFK